MVEDETTTQLLIDCNVDFDQGYYFGRPNKDVAIFEEPDIPLFWSHTVEPHNRCPKRSHPIYR